LRPLFAILTAAFVLVLVVSGLKPRQTEAVPTFAAALGVKCSVCHTMVPELNAYGRYIARSFYQPINTKQTRNELPLWIWYQAVGNNKGSLDSAQSGKKDVLVGDLYLYFMGFLGPQFTYRFDNTIVSGDQATNQSKGPETSWVAYHGLLHGDLHLQFGNDYPGPVPAFVANPSDYENAFAYRHLRIGNHGYNTINDRLTMRADYEKGPIDVEVAWRGGSTSLFAGGLSGTTSDYSIAPGMDRTFPAWKVAYAPPNKPFEFGAFGVTGEYITTLMPTVVDHYNQVAPYFQVDPVGGFPGVMAFFASGHDSNPGIAGFQTIAPQGPNYTDQSVELMEPLFANQAVINLREESVSTGLGVSTHYWSAGTSFYPMKNVPGLIARFDVPMGGYSTIPHGLPTFQWALQFEIPLQGRLTTASSSPAATATSAPVAGPPNGGSIYAAKCSACHGASGQGTPGVFPALAGSKIVNGSDVKSLVNVVALGKGTMPAYRSQFSDADIAALLTYIRSSWGNGAGPVTTDQIAGAK